MNDFIKAITCKQTEKTILVYMKGYKEPTTYTMAIFELLKTDSTVTDIIDAETGELLYTA